MTRVVKGKMARKGKRDETFPFERENYMILAVGLVLIILGYLALSEKTVEGVLPLTVAPILLVIGYCVVIPIGIMYRRKTRDEAGDQDSSARS